MPDEKPLLMYSDIFAIKVGCCAIVKHVDHPKGNNGFYATTTVESHDAATGDFVTVNARYKRLKTAQTVPYIPEPADPVHNLESMFDD